MNVKMILPSLIDNQSAQNNLAYSRFPPLGLATLAGYLREDDDIIIVDEHVQTLSLDDQPDLVVIQVYITNAFRAYKIADAYRARGVYVIMGGLHPTALPEEALQHADTVCLGPGEDTWPQFLNDFRAGHPQKMYKSRVRTMAGMPRIRRDLIRYDLYLAPNSIVVSRGCPHHCDFCYKDSFFKGGKSFYTMRVRDALDEIEQFQWRHVYFLDDNLFADPRFAAELFDGMRPMNRVWQAAGTVQAVLNETLLEKAVAAGLRSLFIGFETLSEANLKNYNKGQNLHQDYKEAIRRLHALGVMVNASFVFGMDHDDLSVFDRTIDWAIENGIETASLHILTPYPGTALYANLVRQNRIIHNNWSLYDTKHAVFQPAKMSPEDLERNFLKAYYKYFKWSSILKAALTHHSLPHTLKHVAYTGGWKKFDPLWSFLIRHGKINRMIPLLEMVLKVQRTQNAKTGSSPEDSYARWRREAVAALEDEGELILSGRPPVPQT
ncbi:MAG TPA: radical SAM protein [Candidatus Omnitrophota bacterium]|nr:B12-binding domain-containing radical SAM protein [Candidatus Omnitrophota bacterium]HQO58593.1 radical SAM protein [Candidatus Omnitrophota bacterium]